MEIIDNIELLKEKREVLEFHVKVAELGVKLQGMGLILAIEPNNEEEPVCVYENLQGKVMFRYPNLDGVELFIKGVEWGRNNDTRLKLMGL